MSVTSILDNMISVTDLNRGGASKTLSRVGNNHPVIVLDGNRPSAVIITPMTIGASLKRKRISHYTKKPWTAYTMATEHN